MKYLFSLLTLLFVASQVNAQRGGNYMDKIAKECCECMEEKMQDAAGDSNNDATVMAMGLCMFDKAMPYQKELKKDYGIDLSDMANIESEGEKLGQLIGVAMVSECPSTLLAMAEMAEGSDLLEDEEEVAGSFEKGGTTEVETRMVKSFDGSITSIENDQFVQFSIADDGGKTRKFLWLGECDNNLLINEDLNDLTGASVRISYIEQELFDPKLMEYRLFYVLTAIHLQ